MLFIAGADVNICMEKDRRYYIEINEWEDNCFVYGDTPLHVAVTQGNIEIVKLLLLHNADVNRGNKYIQTAIDNALHYKQSDIFQEIIFNKRNLIFKYCYNYK
jgi:ankyrin repeat protein